MFRSVSTVYILILMIGLSGPFGEAVQARQLVPVEIDEKRVDAIFSEFDQPGSPGCAVAVTVHGELIFAKGYGMANLDHQIPIRPRSRFMVASITKQFTAASLLMLEQEGKLDLDEDIRPLIPGLGQLGEAMTARQIMHHTSGLRDIYELLILADVGLDNTTTKSQALELIARQRAFNFSPGTEHLYSNSGYFLISLLVYNVSGLTLRDYAERHLFGPSGMNDTHFHDDVSRIVPDRVTSYRRDASGIGRFYRDNMDRVGARGLFTTVEDLARWDANFIRNRTNLERFEERMTEPGTLADDREISYASGLRTSHYKTLETVGHAGSYMGFRTHYLRFPEFQISFIAFCNLNTINPGDYTRRVADLYLGDLFEERLRPYTGHFESETLGSRFEIGLEEGELILLRADGRSEQLRWEGEKELSGNDWQFRFRQKRSLLEVKAARTGAITFIRKTENGE